MNIVSIFLASFFWQNQLLTVVHGLDQNFVLRVDSLYIYHISKYAVSIWMVSIGAKVWIKPFCPQEENYF